MSMKRPWYPRFPDHFLAGTMHMTFEQKAAYSFVIDLAHSADGRCLPIADDDRRIARVLGVKVSRWKRLKGELLALAKLRLIEASSGNQLAINAQSTQRSSSQPIENIQSGENNDIYIDNSSSSLRKKKKKSYQSTDARARSASGATRDAPRASRKNENVVPFPEPAPEDLEMWADNLDECGEYDRANELRAQAEAARRKSNG
jgi:uncharacterized protein YdaU (DUF1376 family)